MNDAKEIEKCKTCEKRPTGAKLKNRYNCPNFKGDKMPFQKCLNHTCSECGGSKEIWKCDTIFKAAHPPGENCIKVPCPACTDEPGRDFPEHIADIGAELRSFEGELLGRMFKPEWAREIVRRLDLVQEAQPSGAGEFVKDVQGMMKYLPMTREAGLDLAEQYKDEMTEALSIITSQREHIKLIKDCDDTNMEQAEKLEARIEKLEEERKRDALDGQATMDECNNEIITLRTQLDRLRWIPVSQPPKKSGLYWVCDNSDKLQPQYVVTWFDGSAFNYRATHWMPISTLPKGDEDGK